jgi:hypothetical protein
MRSEDSNIISTLIYPEVPPRSPRPGALFFAAPASSLVVTVVLRRLLLFTLSRPVGPANAVASAHCRVAASCSFLPAGTRIEPRASTQRRLSRCPQELVGLMAFLDPGGQAVVDSSSSWLNVGKRNGDPTNVIGQKRRNPLPETCRRRLEADACREP